MKKVSRNEPCPCGSGKKYKNCHMQTDAKKSGRNSTFTVGIIIAIFIIMAAIGLYFDAQNDGSVPPQGPAPAGKVWSPEHGHYH